MFLSKPYSLPKTTSSAISITGLGREMAKPLILCDFDNTISTSDVTDALLQRFGMPGHEELENDWVAGKIGSKECMSGQIGLLNASFDELNDCLNQITIDPYFPQFVKTVQKYNIDLHIVSDGLDYAIDAILQRYGLESIPIYANHLVQTGERSWKLDFPYESANCKKKSGHCKCIHTRRPSGYSRRIIYVGDGASDYCVSHQTDWVVAKSNLIDYCRKNRLKHSPIQSFLDAEKLLPTLLPEIFVPVTEDAILV